MTARQYVIPTRPGMGRGLVNHDERSKGFRAVDLTDQTQPRTKSWSRGRAYDQGATSECVAYTGKGLLNTRPLSSLWPYRVRARYNPDTLYAGAQSHDEWPGEAYDGTSALGLCRYLTEQNIIKGYRWCFGVDEVVLTLSWVGPVGIGIQWTNDMFEPDADGYLHPSGSVAGGHEIELTGVDVKAQRVTITNSWGTAWGHNGRAYLAFADLAALLANDGDAVVLL
jgi:hypothetical protein